MEYRQPNPRYRTPNDLPPVAREHYEVARSFDRWFRRSEFVALYAAKYAGRAPGSMMPADYCFNSENRGNTQHPRFLLREGSTYRFVGMDGNGNGGSANSGSGTAHPIPGPPVSPLQSVPIVVPPFPGAEAFLARLRAMTGQPERNMEDAVKDLLLLLGHDPTRIVFQVGRIDVAVRDASGGVSMVIEVKRSLASGPARDDALRKGFDYAGRNGARYVVISDADRFEIYDRTRGLDHASMLCGSLRLTDFHESDVATLDLLRPR